MINRTRKEAYELMTRTSKISDRVTSRITARIHQSGPKPDLDALFTLHSKLHDLYMRFHEEYEAERIAYNRSRGIDN